MVDGGHAHAEDARPVHAVSDCWFNPGATSAEEQGL